MVSLFGVVCACSPASNNGVAVSADSDTQAHADAGSDTIPIIDVDSDTESETEINEDAGVVEMNCDDCLSVGNSLEQMVCAIDLCDPSVVKDVRYTSPSELLDCEIEETYEAIKRFGDESNQLSPMLNDSYALMASGPAEGTAHSFDCDRSQGDLTDVFSGEGVTIHDVMEWKLVLQAPENAAAFRFRYIFFSEEYDEFIGRDYNDKFYAILEHSGTNDGVPTIINFTKCRTPDEYWDFICTDAEGGCELGEKYCYLAVNSAASDCCWFDGCPLGHAWEIGTNIDGTGFECSGTDWDDEGNGSSTGWLQTSWTVSEGEEFSLTFHIHDTADGIIDSAVIIDSFEFMKDPNKGTVEVPPIE